MTTFPLRLITSAAYVEQELSAEFGQLPPSFLPVGLSRLYEAQIARLGADGPIYLTIPESFTPQPYDRHRLETLGVVLVPVLEGLRLGESVVYAINYIGNPAGPVHLLHGDTLIGELPTDDDDILAIHDEGDDYSWAAVDLVGDAVAQLEVISAGAAHVVNRPVACGYFAFSDSAALVRSITRARGDFIAGINLYAHERGLRGARVSDWHDFGHIQTYFRSRRAVSTARAFNALQIDAQSVRKSSEDRDKMLSEAAWFGALPPGVLPYSARLLESGDADGIAFYRTEYQYAPTLAELFVFASIGRLTWIKILRSCQEFLAACVACKGPGSGDVALRDLAVGKTVERLERYAGETDFDIDAPNRLNGRALPSLRRIAEEIAGAIDLRLGRSETLMHGDFCFSNILYNSRAGRITVIDPRGYVQSGVATIFGNALYDLAKLSHSITGYYDIILAGRYVLRRDASHDFAINFHTSATQLWLRDALAEVEVDGTRAGSRPVFAIMVGLFMSMLPLHADRPDRQAAFIANALRLYSDLEGVKP